MTAVPGDRVFVAARGPLELVVSWTVSPATRIRALRALGPRAEHAVPTLRLLADALTREIPLDPNGASATIPAEPGASHVVEIGLATAGGFAPLVASDRVTAPPVAPSTRHDVTWVSAGAPTVPVAHAWSGRRAPLHTPPLDGPRSSELAPR